MYNKETTMLPTFCKRRETHLMDSKGNFGPNFKCHYDTVSKSTWVCDNGAHYLEKIFQEIINFYI